MKRALIIKREYLDKIFAGDKVWEMRSSNTSIRGTVGLIESGSGMIMGEATLVYSTKLPDPCHLKYREFHRVEDLSLLKKWNHAWVLFEAKKYDEPIPYKHPKGAVIWVKL